MIKLTDLIRENSTSTYDYGCVMLYFNVPEMNEIHSRIDKEHVYTESGDVTYGLEDEPHCTLLYGLHAGVSVSDVKWIIREYDFSKCEIHNASLFENDYDVLKFDVKGDSLHECNATLSKLPHTTNYPDYHPHMTIGYLQKGTGKTYVQKLKGFKKSIKPKYIVYSTPNGNKYKIQIKNG